MIEKTKIYIIGFGERSQFENDVYCMKKIKDLNELNIKLDAVFAKDYERFLGVKEYCKKYKIELVNIKSNEEDFISILQYSVNNLDKKNLATLISEKKASNLNWLFRQDLDFEPHII